jgi:hypothetical protein
MIPPIDAGVKPLPVGVRLRPNAPDSALLVHDKALESGHHQLEAVPGPDQPPDAKHAPLAFLTSPARVYR